MSLAKCFMMQKCRPWNPFDLSFSRVFVPSWLKVSQLCLYSANMILNYRAIKLDIPKEIEQSQNRNDAWFDLDWVYFLGTARTIPNKNKQFVYFCRSAWMAKIWVLDHFNCDYAQLILCAPFQFGCMRNDSMISHQISGAENLRKEKKVADLDGCNPLSRPQKRLKLEILVEKRCASGELFVFLFGFEVKTMMIPSK